MRSPRLGKRVVLIERAVLVLNASYEPIAISTARDAVKKLIKRIAVTEIENDYDIYPGLTMPSVIRLLEYRRIPEHHALLTRKNFYVRDRFRCQYCGVRFEAKDLTLDHVYPKSRGGPNSWQNLVTCCKPCNRMKADKTLEECGMVLLHKPKQLTVHTSKYLMRRLGLDEDERWGQYLYA
jgi:5-methylcytosine-specific restriction endonuclease McrA